jgi:hypothetical protein
VSGSAKVRYGMISPIHVLKIPMSDHSLKSGAAMAIWGKVEIVSTMARIRNFPRNLSRASAYAQNDPTASASTVVLSATTALLRSALVKSGLLKTSL